MTVLTRKMRVRLVSSTIFVCWDTSDITHSLGLASGDSDIIVVTLGTVTLYWMCDSIYKLDHSKIYAFTHTTITFNGDQLITFILRNYLYNYKNIMVFTKLRDCLWTYWCYKYIPLPILWFHWLECLGQVRYTIWDLVALMITWSNGHIVHWHNSN